MRLVGQQVINPAEGDHTLIASMFDRLPREIGSRIGLTRLVGYQTSEFGSGCLKFFGMEADTIQAIPEGLVAWDLADATWTVWRTQDGRNLTLWKEEIAWEWRSTSRSASGRQIGEFTARGAPEWWGDAATGQCRSFSVFATVYVSNRKGSFDDNVRLVEYDATWPERYEQMAGWLEENLGARIARRVEHYGSTAVPHMPAKPIIDILIEVPSFAEAKSYVFSVLSDETWEYWWYAGHMVFFKRREVMGERTHHIHMAPPGHEIWKGLAFRDYLRTHQDDACRYAALKHGLADLYGDDRERYTQAKAAFVHEITLKALTGEDQREA